MDARPFGTALVFDVEEDEVDAYRGRHSIHDASHFHEDGHAGSAVIGTGYGFVLVGLSGVVVGPLAAIPMCGKEDTLVSLGVELADDILARHGGAVPEHGAEILHDDGVAETTHLRRQPGGATFPAVAAGDAVAEGELFLHIGVGRVGRELRDDHLGIICRRRRRTC